MFKKYLVILSKSLFFFSLFFFSFLVLFSAYQDFSNKNEYSYFNLWNYKTREKVFIKNETKIFLIGMIHIGSKKYYRQIIERPRIIENYMRKGITLMEGVSNVEKDKNAPSLNYEELVKNFSLVSQSKYTNDFPNVVYADIDFKDISKESKEDLNIISKLLENVSLFSNKKITYKQLRQSLSHEEENLSKVVGNLKNGSLHEQILKKRNDHLWEQIKKAEDKYQTIIVPWGADHLIDIENRLILEGYKQEGQTEYVAINAIKIIKEFSILFIYQMSK